MWNKIIKTSVYCAYILFALGQVGMYLSKIKEADLYNRINEYPIEWAFNHALSLLGTMLIIPCTFWLKQHLSFTKGKWLAFMGFILVCCGVFSLLGQYFIDFWLLQIFKQERELALLALERIQNNSIIDFLFYEMAALWLLGQILLGTAMILARKNYLAPALILFLGLALLIVAKEIHPIISRLSYAILAIPILIIYKKNKIKAPHTIT